MDHELLKFNQKKNLTKDDSITNFAQFDQKVNSLCVTRPRSLGPHILSKSLIGGIVQRIDETDDLEKTGGIWNSHTVLGVVFLLQAFSLAGVPPLSGFWGKYLILVESVRQQHWVFAVAVLLAGVLTLLSMLKIWLGVFWGTKQVPSSPTFVPGKLASIKVGLCTVVLLTSVSLLVGLGFPSVVSLAEIASRVSLDKTGYQIFGKSSIYHAFCSSGSVR